MKEVTIIFFPEKKKVTVSLGTDLLTAAVQAGAPLVSSCGGKGICGRCRVKILKGNFETEATGKISPEDKDKQIYLACRTFAHSDMDGEILPESQLATGVTAEIHERKSPQPFLEEIEGIFPLVPLTKKFFVPLRKPSQQLTGSNLTKIETLLTQQGIAPLSTNLATLRRLAQLWRQNQTGLTVTVGERDDRKEIILLEPGDTSGRHFGVAVDVGTTTVSASLLCLNTGQTLRTELAFNRQASYGEDVVTRIVFAEKEKGLEQLHHAVVETINQLIFSLAKHAGVGLQEITAVVCSGNMTMSHLLLKIDPFFLRREPYEPIANHFPVVDAAEAGIRINPSGLLAVVGGVSSYVGGDITAGLLSVPLARKSEISLLLDIGTNGEMVLGNKDWLVCCSASAGP
ncbi:MAG: ASKHA domain-containing protein, partial [Candidatus Omnitrophica bacterium]|nr:ASKHA domain-containing protein [Candidatus Omnitrophota bacterium]